MELNRRHALAAGAAAFASAAFGAPAAADSLNALAKRNGRRFGSAVAWGKPGADRGSFANPAYARILERECGLLVPENELKWQWSRPGPDKFDFRQMDAIADYATSTGSRCAGTRSSGRRRNGTRSGSNERISARRGKPNDC